MERLEQRVLGMTELIDRYRKEICAISEEVLGRNHEVTGEVFRDKLTEVQDRMHVEACEMYDRLVAESKEIERELVAKLTQMRETLERAALLREIIRWTVKPGVGH